MNNVERLIRLRKEHPEFSFGTCSIVDSPEPAIFGLRADWQGNTTIAVHNLANRAAKARVNVSRDGATELLDVLGGERYAARADGSVDVELEPYGFRWLNVRHG